MKCEDVNLRWTIRGMCMANALLSIANAFLASIDHDRGWMLFFICEGVTMMFFLEFFDYYQNDGLISIFGKHEN